MEIKETTNDMKKDLQGRRFQLTINNPKEKYNHEYIKKSVSEKFKSFQYCAMSDEIGEQGTYHTHIFLVFNNPVRFSTLKKVFETAHIETCKGSIQDNINYLKKEGKWAETKKSETSVPNTFEEIGNVPVDNVGRRQDLYELYHMIVDEHLNNDEIISRNTDYILQIDKLDKIRLGYLIEHNKSSPRLDLKVTYVFGKTGTGKSRDILERHGYENVYRVTDYEHPFDGYTCQEVIVFEEFRSSLKVQDMLNYLDIYPLQLPSRYSNKYACYHYVYICSNWELEQQYSEIKRNQTETYNAFLRRIGKITEYYAVGRTQDYEDINAYLHRKEYEAMERLYKEDMPFN